MRPETFSLSELRKRWSLSRQFYYGALALGISVLIFIYLVFSKPEADKAEPQGQGRYVEFVEVDPGPEQMTISAKGVVTAHQQVVLQAEVAGKVVFLSEKLVAGGMFAKDEVLFRVDSRDIQSSIVEQQSALASARLNLRVEESNARVAKEEWGLLGTKRLSGTNDKSADRADQADNADRELALRVPQLADAKAKVLAAEARLGKLNRDLERSEVKAPFAGVVVEEDITVGQLVGAQNGKVMFASNDIYDIVASLKLSDLPWIAGRDEFTHYKARFRSLGVDRERWFVAHPLSIVPSLDKSGRMARMILRAIAAENPQIDTVLLNDYVDIEIDGPMLDDVVSLSAALLREGKNVWIFGEDSRLKVKQVEVLLRAGDIVKVRGLDSGDRVITTGLPSAFPGMLLRAK
ncbi:MAG: hypothetical protein PHC51_05070 [bacterium]|nr:hypothetical protein [bacterium]